MITERVLRRIAGRENLGVGRAEHEYAMLCVLDALGQTSPLSRALCLKGGTALRLIFFEDWRHSVDLDFSTLPGLRPEDLRSHMLRWFGRVDVIHGMTVRLLDFHSANGAARIRAQFVGPLRHPARLLFDVTMDEPVVLPAERRAVRTSPFADLHPVVQTYQLEEILAEKMRSILQRGKSRDYYDVWRLLRDREAAYDASTVRLILQQKCRYSGLDQPSVRAFLVLRHLEEAGAYWERDLANQVSPRLLPGWDAVASELAELLERFFGQ